MKTKIYQVIYQSDEEDIERNIFHLAPLDMCCPGHHCGCFDKGEMDICDHMFTETKDISIAEDKVNMLNQQGVRRVWIKELNKPVIVTKGNK